MLTATQRMISLMKTLCLNRLLVRTLRHQCRLLLRLRLVAFLLTGLLLLALLLLLGLSLRLLPGLSRSKFLNRVHGLNPASPARDGMIWVKSPMKVIHQDKSTERLLARMLE